MMVLGKLLFKSFKNTTTASYKRTKKALYQGMFPIYNFLTRTYGWEWQQRVDTLWFLHGFSPVLLPTGMKV